MTEADQVRQFAGLKLNEGNSSAAVKLARQYLQMKGMAAPVVACPLLEDIDIRDARGVLVNISAAKSTLRMKEMHEVMNTIKTFTADSATVIVGAVFDDSMQEDLRVTIVATGLGSPVVNRQQSRPLSVIKTGTDSAPILAPNSDVDYEALEQPAVIRNRLATVEAMKHSGVEELDIPAFLRKQAD